MSIKANIVASPPSASTIALTATTGCHLLKIDGYSHARLVGNGKRFMSAKFKAAGHTWRILFYPTDKFRMDGDMVSLYLKLVDRSKNVTAEVQFSMLHRSNADETPNPFNHQKMWYTFESARCNNKCGFSWFVGAKETTDTPLYKYVDKDDDFVVIRCDIKVINKPTVHADSLDELGLICHCKDDTCKRLHDTSPATSAQPGVYIKRAFTSLFSCFLA